MVIFPSCKINLGLHILSKRDDGFHAIETIFYPIHSLSDVLEIIPNGKKANTFTQKGIYIGQQTELNLVEKACHLLQQHYDIPSVDMFLYKNIPIGAGLGGGSSDASFALKLLNNLFNIRLSNEELRVYAGLLGSDCPFFIENIPALGKGKGEELTTCSIPQLSGKYIVIVKPSISVSTSEAYRNCMPIHRNDSLAKIISQTLPIWKDTLVNDFETTLFPIYPELKEIKESLYKQGAIYASLSGSGSALFGIFSEEPLSLHFKNSCFVFQGRLE